MSVASLPLDSTTLLFAIRGLKGPRIVNQAFYLGRTLMDAHIDDETDITGWKTAYLKVDHPVDSATVDYSVVETDDACTDDVTYFKLYDLDNGKILVDYRFAVYLPFYF